MRDEDLALIIASCRALGGVDVVLLEPLRDIHSGKENESDGMAPVFKRLRLLGELLNATPGTAHHNKKGSEGRGGEKVRGSGAIHGSVDSGFYLCDLGGDGVSKFENTIESEIKGARSAGKFRLTLELTDVEDRADRAVWTHSKEFVKPAIAELRQEPSAKTDDEAILNYLRTHSAISGNALRGIATGIVDVFGNPLSSTRVQQAVVRLTDGDKPVLVRRMGYGPEPEKKKVPEALCFRE